MKNDQLTLQPSTITERKYGSTEKQKVVKENPYKSDFRPLFGLPQTAIGKRANSIDPKTINKFKGTVSTDLQSLTTDIIPFMGSTYSLGTTSKTFASIYVDSIFSSTGTALLTFKTIATPLGTSVIADSLTDTLTLASASGAIKITGNAVTDTVDLDVDLTVLDNTFFKLDGTVAITGNTTINANLTLSADLIHTGTRVGFFGTTPITKRAEITDELTSITHTAPVTPDYALQDLTSTTPFGFVTKDEGNTLLSVVANLQTRVKELEDVLSSYGLLTDAD